MSDPRTDALNEALARGKHDFKFFCAFFLDLYLHDGQEMWGKNANQKQNVLVPGNRWGKSVIEAARHIHKNFYKLGDGWYNFHFKDKTPTRELWTVAPYQTLNCSISADQSEIVFREAVTFCRRPKMAPFVKGIFSTPFPRIEFWNGSVMHARSTSDNGKYIDGHHYAFMSYDEAGWEPHLDWLMGTVLLPRMLDWGGHIDVVGTPKGRGYLYQLMMKGLNGDPNVYSQQGSTYDNPYVSEDEVRELEAQLTAISPKLARQAIHGDFIDADGLVFTFDQIQGNFVDRSIEVEVTHVAHGVLYQAVGFEPDPTHRYISAFDLARRTDRTVGIVLDVTNKPFTVAAALLLNQCPWESQYEWIRKWSQLYNCLPVIDSTGIGDVVDEELTKRGIAHDVFSFNDGKGVLKDRLIINLQNAFDFGRPAEGSPEADEREWGMLRTGLIPPLLEELSIYERDDKKLSTDCVMSLAIAVWKAYRSHAIAAPVKKSMRGRRR